jgi:polyhydroxyalkanoate synthase subunit PhaC
MSGSSGWGPMACNFDEVVEKYTAGMRILLEGPRAETGQTPKKVIWTRNKAKLYRYEPMVEKRCRVPLLMIYALINRPYVLDLLPGNSFVEFLVSQGFDVYLLDWGIPGDEDKDLSFEDYVLDYIPRAVAKVQRASASEAFSLLGYCMGGTMTAMYTALFPDAGIKNLILLTAPIDFTPDKVGLYGLWTSTKHFDPDRAVDAFGNIPADLIDTANRMLKPVTNYVGTYAMLWDRIMEGKSMDMWLAMNKWVNDGVPFPGAAFRQWIRDFYQQNKLVKGTIQLRGRRVDLANIRCSLLTIAGKRDHICRLPQAEAAMRLVSSRDKELFVLEGGHVGLLTGSEAKYSLWPEVCTWLSARSQ